MRRLTATVGVTLLALSLTACASGEEDPKTGERTNLDVRHVQVDDRLVTCIVYRAGYAGGLSCDWQGAR